MTPDQIYETFGANLRAQRDHAGYTQQSFADRSGFSRTSISNIETGRQRILLHHIYDFASILDVPVQSLLPLASKRGVDTVNVKQENLSPDERAFLQQILA